MENIIFGTEVPVLTGDTIADMTNGQIGLLVYSHDEGAQPVLRGTEVTNTELMASRAVQFIKKGAFDFEASLVIPTKTTFDRNFQAYVAPVAGVYKLGDNAAVETALTIPAEGEGNIRLVNATVDYQVDSFPANISVTKRSTETPVQYLNRVVAAINADAKAKTLVVAALETNTGRYQIKLTTLDASFKLLVSTDGIFEPYRAITVTPRVIGKGTYAQMSAIERNLTVFKGNGNYIDYGDLWYKEPLKSIPGTNYDTMSITWTAIARPTHSTTMAIANPNLLICTPAADNTLAALFAKFVTPDPVV